MMDSIYAHFTSIVGEGRKLKPEQVEQVARGRVWSGRMAQKIGLVDELGGLDIALDRAAQKSGGKDRGDIHVVVYPKPMTPVERVLDFLETQAKLGTTLKTMSAVLDMPQNSAGVTAFEGLRVK
jgi:protease-4